MAATLAEREVAEGVGSWREQIPTPGVLASTAMAQQASIAAGDHCEAAAHEVHGGEAARGCFPGFIGEVARAEQCRCDVTVTGATESTIHGLQHPSRTLTLLPCEPRVGRDRTAMERTQETGDGLEPIEPFGAERDHSRRAFSTAPDAEAQDLEPFAVREAVKEVEALRV